MNILLSTTKNKTSQERNGKKNLHAVTPRAARCLADRAFPRSSRSLQNVDVFTRIRDLFSRTIVAIGISRSPYCQVRVTVSRRVSINDRLSDVVRTVSCVRVQRSQVHVKACYARKTNLTRMSFRLEAVAVLARRLCSRGTPESALLTPGGAVSLLGVVSDQRCLDLGTGDERLIGREPC